MIKGNDMAWSYKVYKSDIDIIFSCENEQERIKLIEKFIENIVLDYQGYLVFEYLGLIDNKLKKE